MKRDVSNLAGKSVMIKDWVNELGGSEILIEDWWENVYGISWMFSDSNPAAMFYAVRVGFSSIEIPNNNDVLYGKIGSAGYLVHITELEI